MQKYSIYAKDGTDEGALDRRLAARQSHFDGIQILKDQGNFVLGGALVDDAGKMIGSTIILQFETPADLQKWLDHEPYNTQGVWQSVEILRFGVPPPK
ncbi:MAG: hypothetical protein RL329_2740 [Bacteroidota bacterium]